MQPFTPKLKPGEKTVITNFPYSGNWHTRNVDELNRLADSLLVQDIDATYFEIDCIPNMWGCPLLFDMALYDKAHLLHNRVLGEWRGFLAMLAFKELMNLDLRMEKIQIPKPGESNQFDFLKALGRLAPERKLADDISWFTLYIILCNTKVDVIDTSGNITSSTHYMPIGITSPTTLVCTGRDYRVKRIENEETKTITTFHSLHGIVDWFDGKYLSDPTSKLDQEKRSSLAGWLNQLSKSLANRPNVDSVLRQALTSLINDFKNSLDSGAEVVELSQKSLGLDDGVYSCIDKPIYKPDIFTKKLFLIQQRNALPGTLNPQVDLELGEVTPIIPIKSQELSKLGQLNGAAYSASFSYIF